MLDLRQSFLIVLEGLPSSVCRFSNSFAIIHPPSKDSIIDILIVFENNLGLFSGDRINIDHDITFLGTANFITRFDIWCANENVIL